MWSRTAHATAERPAASGGGRRLRGLPGGDIGPDPGWLLLHSLAAQWRARSRARPPTMNTRPGRRSNAPGCLETSASSPALVWCKALFEIRNDFGWQWHVMGHVEFDTATCVCVSLASPFSESTHTVKPLHSGEYNSRGSCVVDAPQPGVAPVAVERVRSRSGLLPPFPPELAETFVAVVLPHPPRTMMASISAKIPAVAVGDGLRWPISDLPLGSMLP